MHSLSSSNQASKDSKADFQAIVYPFPSEVVGSIAEFALIGPGEDGLMGRNERHVFLALRSICRPWREALFSFPSLWRGISVTTDEWAQSGGSPGEDFVRQLTSWYSRGGVGAPLSLEVISVPQLPEQVYRLTAQEVMKLVRLPDLHFTTLRFPATGNFSSLNTVVKTPLTRIKTLGLRVYTHDGLRLGQPTIDLSAAFPNLERLDLIDPLPIRVAHRTVPEVRFKRAEGVTAGISHVLERFARVESLHIIEERTLRFNDESRQQSPPHTFQNIKTFTLSGPVAPAFIQDLVFPSLEFLIIQELPAVITHDSITGSRLQSSVENILIAQPTPTIVAELIKRSQPTHLTLYFDNTCPSRLVREYASQVEPIHCLQVQSLKDLIPDKPGSTLEYPSSLCRIDARNRLREEEFEAWREHSMPLFHSDADFPEVTFGKFNQYPVTFQSP